MKPLNMRLERIKNKWTLEYVGQQIGKAKNTVHDIENGKYPPTYDVLVKLSRLYKKCPFYLLAQEGKVQSPRCKILSCLLAQAETPK